MKSEYKSVRELFEYNYHEDPIHISQTSDGTTWEAEG